MDKETADKPPDVVSPSEGVTPAERYLGQLCRRSFLPIWSYPGVFRDQGRKNGKGDGKEVCDLLVVFDNHAIIFSDKDVRFGGGDIAIAWPRWYRKAVLKSAEQVWAAERWIKTSPHLLYIDRKCTAPFPIALPDPDKAIFHRIVVAHDAARASREKLGGSGSLMIDSTVVGEAHLKTPFTIGQVDPRKGYVHVFDDTTLNVVMKTLDTITDFTAYLEKKERFLTVKKIHAAGEEELLAIYLKRTNATNEHDFVFSDDDDSLIVGEGLWKEFALSPQRKAQLKADRISYLWDHLIEKFAFHAMTGTQHFKTGRPFKEQEPAFRFLAREPRLYRRALSGCLLDLLKKSVTGQALNVRTMTPLRRGGPYYVFVLLRRDPGISDNKYRMMRHTLLTRYCEKAKLNFPEAIDILGIATEAGFGKLRSEDYAYIDSRLWTPDIEKAAREFHKEFKKSVRPEPTKIRVFEYPAGESSPISSPKPLSRNSPCWCKSGKRYKRCHGQES